MDKKTLKSILIYDKKTGIFRWKSKTSRKTVVGNIAGGLDKAGYIVIGYSGRTYYAHRLAWMYEHGYFPNQIDHKDGNRQNNKLSNLRECSHSQNIFNAKIAKNNCSGFKGVSWQKSANKWAAYIHFDNKKKHLGLFDTPEMAAQAYLNAVKNIEPEYVREK